MIDRTPKSRVEIEQLVLNELRDAANCGGAGGGISIVACGPSFSRDLYDDENWTVAAFDAGTASDYECERALISIVKRLQGFYELVQKH